jgi:hypothetical protein
MNRITRSVVGLVASAALVAGAAPSPAAASPPDRVEAYPGIDFPDFENGFVVFVNTTRDSVCTQEQVQAELDFLDWAVVFGDAFFQYLDENDGDPSGFPGEFPPPEPPRPEGIAPFTVQQKQTGKGAIVQSARGKDIPTELWRQVENPPGVGPCTDTTGQSEPFATGTSMARSNSNNLNDSSSRNTSFGNHLKASLTDADGNSFVYDSRFHLNFRCNAPDFAPPACLVERTSIR